MFWVYVLENPHGKFYVGQSQDLAQRLLDHNRTDRFEGHFTRKNGPWKLVWSEAHETRSSAVQRERQIKRMKSAKWIRVNLLDGESAAVNPDASGL
jgi:putative endonuclease